MRILGIDPGLTRCGLGTIDFVGARRVSFVDVDVARSNPAMLPEKRLLLIHNKLAETIRLLRPDVIAIERVFAQENVRSVVSTAQVVGISMLCAAQHGIPVQMHSPSEVKAAVSGNGRASKAQVQLMVKQILGLKEIVRPKDAADALAIAICHAWRGNLAVNTNATRAQHGGAGTLPRAEGVDLTAAQKLWAQAERLQARHGAVAPEKFRK
ncbi:crossover junction endodeoxyribonuclease RuvC [Arcanobacterium hippocoleae]|uniref:Crossover junction endodeoxyribonuclease RuvC n=1 Tax=Arcanobacterium hippocoleae TaxID=149017 RepID=A0ABU1T052_9ACTO|nr:crossover junction endodeoxyribonuclease RuvC [Arcanobacterium hippocoleae]MDR6938727.1 crossover junction endodeoxyribonuclease RuvC [Arcanobacterium hippocoleae]